MNTFCCCFTCAHCQDNGSSAGNSVTACEYAFGVLAALSLVFWVVSKATSKGGKKA